MKWQFHEAEEALEDLFIRAIEVGPQFIARDTEEVVMLSRDTYRALQGAKPDFIQHVLSIPKIDDLDLKRDQSPMREIDLSK